MFPLKILILPIPKLKHSFLILSSVAAIKADVSLSLKESISLENNILMFYHTKHSFLQLSLMILVFQ